MIVNMESGQRDRGTNLNMQTLPKEVGKFGSCHFHIFYIILGAYLEISRLKKISFHDYK
jgi:hypothetical protein